MASIYMALDDGPVTEMAIVNTFTKLIFGEDDYSPSELSIIAAFRALDCSTRLDDSPAMGEYLRSLGVREMTQLVSRVLQYLRYSTATPRPLPGRQVSALVSGIARG